MPRRPGVFVENGFYHLILRGNAREALFRCDKDFETFQKLAVEGLKRWLQTQFVLELFSADMAKARQRYARFITDVGGCEQRHTIDAAIWAHNGTSPLAIDGIDCRTSTARLNDYFLRQQSLTIELLMTLKGPGRVRRNARLRAQLVAQALDDRVATLTELAAYFGRSSAAISRTLSHYRDNLSKNK